MTAVRFELDIEGLPRAVAAEIEGTFEAVVAFVRQHLASGEIFLFERDKEDLFSDAGGRKAIALVAHRAKSVLVNVQFEHLSKPHKFSPSTTVNTVLRWAVGKQGFNLDDNAAAKANLMRPGASEPLDRSAVIGTLFGHHEHELTLELTLKDFTNGDR